MRTRPALAAAVLVAVAAATASACLWDTDTLGTELDGIADTAKVIAGSFPRNPPLYYEMRLERAARRVEADRSDFEAYDDAGVACDRLHRDDEALVWMERKAAALSAVSGDTGDGPPRRPAADVDEHRYRMLANTGTFRVHRWLRSGADRTRIDEVRRAADEIRAAIELNPDAHFGRERYQLRALEWIVAGEPYREAREGEGALVDFLGLRRERGLPATDANTRLEELGMKDAVLGLSGLVVLGDAWESVDCFYALVLAAQVDGRSKVAALARMRIEELVAAGRGSLVPGAPTGDALLRATELYCPVPADDLDDLRAAYRTARASSDAWQARRTAFMLPRLRAGRHPDTDATFWDGWER